MAKELSLAIIEEYEARSRAATLVDKTTGTILHDITVPLSVQGVEPKSEVLYSPENSVVLALLSNPEVMVTQEDHVPRAQGRGGYIQSRFKNQQSTKSVPGDMLFQGPGTGFLYALKNYLAGIGTTNLSKIMFYGLRNLVEVTAKNFSLTNGGSVKFNVNTAVDGVAKVSIELGTSKLETDGISHLNLSLGPESNLLGLTIDDKVLRVSVFGTQLFMFDLENQESVLEIVAPIKVLMDSVTAIVRENLKITVAKDAKISATSFMVGTDDFIRLLSKNVTINASNEVEVKGQNIAIIANANKGNGGMVQIKSGKKSGASFDGMKGQVKLKGMKMELLGTGEHLANGDAVVENLNNLYNLVADMCMTLSTSLTPAPGAPLCPAITPSQVKALTYLATTPLSSNKMIEVPKFLPNGMKP